MLRHHNNHIQPLTADAANCTPSIFLKHPSFTSRASFAAIVENKSVKIVQGAIAAALRFAFIFHLHELSISETSIRQFNASSLRNEELKYINREAVKFPSAVQLK